MKALTISLIMFSLLIEPVILQYGNGGGYGTPQNGNKKGGGCSGGGAKPGPSTSGGVDQRPDTGYPQPQPPTDGQSDACTDSNENCCFWAAQGQCDSNLYWMRPNCQKACGTCGCTVAKAPSCQVKLGACESSPGPSPPAVAETPTPDKPQEPPAAETPAPPAPEPPPAAETPAPAPPLEPQTTLAPAPPVAPPQETGDCSDKNELCCFWASLGHCDSNPLWMRPNCQKACGTCGCTFETAASCPVKLGSCSSPGAPGEAPQITQEPVTTEAPRPPPPVYTPAPAVPSPSGSCQDSNELCCFWASQGHCDSNLFWMRPNCQKACGTCGCTVATALTCKVNLGSCNNVPGPPGGANPAPAPATEAPLPETQPPAPPTTASPGPSGPSPGPGPVGPSGYGSINGGGPAGVGDGSTNFGSGGGGYNGGSYMGLGQGGSPGGRGTGQSDQGYKQNGGGGSYGSHTGSGGTVGGPSGTSGQQGGSECVDKNDLCCFWASLGHCDSNPLWMRPNCQKACGTCGCTFETAASCTVKLGSCDAPGAPGAPGGAPPDGQEAQATDAPPAPESPPSGAEVPEPQPTEAPEPAPTDAPEPPPGEPPATPAPPESQQPPASPPPQPSSGACDDSNELCCFWASLGHCDSNLFWMRPNCQKACGTCGCTIESAPTCTVNLGGCDTGAPGMPSPATGGNQQGTGGQTGQVGPSQVPGTMSPGGYGSINSIGGGSYKDRGLPEGGYGGANNQGTGGTNYRNQGGQGPTSGFINYMGIGQTGLSGGNGPQGSHGSQSLPGYQKDRVDVSYQSIYSKKTKKLKYSM